MRNTAFFIAGFVLVLLQSNLFRLTRVLLGLLSWIFRTETPITVPGLVPSLVLPLILFMGVHEYSLVRGASVAFALGYLSDLVGVAPLGLYTSTYVAIYILARAAGVRLAAQAMWMQIALALGFALVHSVMVLVLLAIFGRDAWVPRSLLGMIVPHVLATGAVAPLVFRLAQRIHVATNSSARTRSDVSDLPKESPS
ncbi:MAG TPA: rod shape-determining protein MreD [Labilithrix sp.]|jgi:rod shape-determining protein MreD